MAISMTPPQPATSPTSLTPVSFTLVDGPCDIDAAQWDALAGGQPFMRHAFLRLLDEHGCAVARTGWSPRFLLMHRGATLAGAMPLYLKTHSRGEYVFDYAWANAFDAHGLKYYPKLLCAVPFTPVPGPRLLAACHEDRVALARAAAQIADDNGLSSLHALFPSTEDQRALEDAGFMMRDDIQFCWINRGYESLDEFLASLNQPKRKKLRQDRKKAIQAGVDFRWLQGADITTDVLAFFFRCYQQTYLEHGHLPYLNHAFFSALHATMPEAMVMVLAERQGQPIATALNLRDDNTLYGRYWGSVDYIPGLHFETCYLQGIEFCIQHGLQRFEGGAQGEHKLSRGMMPARTRSAHWIRDPRFAAAIETYLARETAAVDAWQDELAAHSPYRRENPQH